MNFEFPEIEEYFIYNPKSSYPTGGGNANMGRLHQIRGVKLQKMQLLIVLLVLVDRNKGILLYLI
jgi:hypothetical protein